MSDHNGENSAEESKMVGVNPKTVADLSSGILSSCEAELQSVSKELKDFTEQQNTLIEKLAKYNIEGDTSPVHAQLKNAMELINIELDRLTLLRHDMTTVQERSQKLRARAEKLRLGAEDKERRDEDLVAQLVGSNEPGGGSRPGPESKGDL